MAVEPSACPIHYSFLILSFSFGGGCDAYAYDNVPMPTNAAPKPSWLFHPDPKYQTLMQRLSALRVVSARLVDTDDVPEQNTSRLLGRQLNGGARRG